MQSYTLHWMDISLDYIAFILYRASLEFREDKKFYICAVFHEAFFRKKEVKKS